MTLTDKASKVNDLNNGKYGEVSCVWHEVVKENETSCNGGKQPLS